MTSFRAQKDPKILLVDCRPKQEFNEGVIRSDNWLNLGHYEVRKFFLLPDNEFKTKLGLSKPDTNTEIICYCREGRRAQDAVMSFIELGYRNWFSCAKLVTLSLKYCQNTPGFYNPSYLTKMTAK